MGNQNGFESDEEEQYFLDIERKKQEEAYYEDEHYKLIEILDNCAYSLGLDYAISYLESLKIKEQQKWANPYST